MYGVRWDSFKPTVEKLLTFDFHVSNSPTSAKKSANGFIDTFIANWVKTKPPTFPARRNVVFNTHTHTHTHRAKDASFKGDRYLLRKECQAARKALSKNAHT